MDFLKKKQSSSSPLSERKIRDQLISQYKSRNKDHIEDQKTLYSQDQKWRFQYLSQLDPNDETGSFLMPEELPSIMDSQEKILQSISIATYRSLPLQRLIRIEKPIQGFIQGKLGLLLPQGKEIIMDFKNEFGWKATAIFQVESGKLPITVYHCSACMNPIRNLSGNLVAVDNSKISFRPILSEKPEMILVNTTLNELIDENMTILKEEYNDLNKNN
ncbi:MAG: hypothetical protein GY820_17890 [Gammaproteobacteria bacterium]|nr:hypothetical protein [Gammaproteobacteria bacterium]